MLTFFHEFINLFIDLGSPTVMTLDNIPVYSNDNVCHRQVPLLQTAITKHP